jgi:hypothetical protein
MKWFIAAFIFVSSVAMAQDKPRVFVQGKGSQDVTSSGSGGGGRHWGTWGSSSTIDSHDEGMQVTKDLQKDCSGVIVTLNQSNADYTVMLNRESKKNRGLLRTNSQVEVANKLGDVVGTNATRSVGNASKDACQLIVADWSQHGRIQDPAAAAVAPAAPATADGAKLQPASAVSVQPEAAPSQAAAPAAGSGSSSLGDAAKRARQHQACLELAKDNPSVTCN